MLKGLNGIQSHETTLALPIVANNQDMQQLSNAVRLHLNGTTRGILVAGHGLYAWGDNLEQARRHVEIIEFLLSAHLQYQQLCTMTNKTDS